MVSCKHCQTPNSLDSTFCKRCGAPVAEADLKEAQAKLEKLVEDGNALFNSGRTDEALAIAEAAVLSNPSSTSAWSLKTLCHERRGEIAEALECADRLVELNPESDFDKIRRSTLRQKLQTDLHVPAAPDRRLAGVAALSAVVLVLCTGAIVARISSNGSTASRANPNGSLTTVPPVASNPQSTAPTTAGTNPNVVNSAPMGDAPAANQPAMRDPSAVPPLHEEASRRPSSTPIQIPDAPSGELPNPTQDGIVVTPIQPKVDFTPESSQPNQRVKLPTPKSTPTTDVSGDPTVMSTPEEKKEEDHGIIEITEHKGGSSSPRVLGGGESINGNGLETLVRVGSQQFQLGNYAAAAKSYEQAVRNGGDAIILNRRLAQAYERLGRASDAADAYRRCIAAIDASLAAGRGNKDTLGSTRDLCQQALKVLQGG